MGFRLGSIPVRVHVSFLMMTALLAMSGGRADPTRIVLWVASVFFSVLIHELGHATMGRAFGLAPQIDIHGMGGTTSWQVPIGAPAMTTGRRVLISLAGPGIGFVFGGIVYAVKVSGVLPPSSIAEDAARMLMW